ncbi:O-acetylhomoserine aminocarboxypropyltransferase/cysteine synthase family protein [Desulfonatronovibrio hydrogenovorans]|uniref:O-acetylhomoserine aminocarboxypropyltransferase/cysteine synthase family protein n=1 Tax=Desulfonatronovibrio hydrogenovorans TaxID=53245 RepID=UPI00068FF806|nr:O-acetylhomoserine aminocarboxypropyltransferase/cysteine synthase family protein [Desulfonatronovibrio hydrogenovorans]
MDVKQNGFMTKVLHAGHHPDQETGSRAVPIYQTTSYMFRDSNHAADLFALKEPGYIYTRIMNPTTEVLEKRLAALHNGCGSLAVASGMAAIFYAVTNIAGVGQNIVSGSNLYGGTHTLFSHTLKRFGIEVRFVDSSDPGNFARSTDQNTRLLFTESVGNPRCNIDDLEAMARVAHDHGLPLVVDNTSTPPPLFNPFDWGADILVYSLTKMVGGHGTCIGGAIVEKGGFPWESHGRYPEMTGPDSSYHDLNMWEAMGCDKKGKQECPIFTLKARTGLLRDTGAALSPMNSFLILQGLETLPLRAAVHAENALKVAEHLEKHPLVSWVNYAGLPSHPDHERARRMFPRGCGAVFGFRIKGGLEAARKFVESVRLCSHLANILDARTLVIHPAGTTHQQLSPEEQAAAGVSQDMIRISVGLEDIEDILADLDQALEKTQ